MRETVTVLGCGSWGTALAEVQARLGHRVILWGRKESELSNISKLRENRRYHPGVTLSKNIEPETNLQKAASKGRLLIVAVPSHAVRETLESISSKLDSDAILICAAKGIEMDSQMTLSDVATDVLGKERAKKYWTVLSGPTFASEVIRGQPTALTLAAHSEKVGNEVQKICHADTFYIYTTEDVTGVELAGALKNVIAIAAGVSDGYKFGLNARASLITRGLAEITRMGTKMGANPLTFAGLAGLGDLILTCTGDLSRNRRFGLAIAQGKSLREALKEVGQVVEGIRTAKAAFQLSTKLGVEVPILREIYNTLYEQKSPQQAIRDLLSRPPTRERD